MDQYVYIALNLFTLSIPLIMSFEKKIRFVRDWKYVIPAILLTAIPFLLWDIWFTRINVWHFTYRFTIGIYFINLPLEEGLFFFTVPFACLFIYAVIKHYLGLKFNNVAKYILLVTAFFLIVRMFLNLDSLYTLITFSSLSAFIIFHIFFIRSKYLGSMLISYLICLIPFFIINGVLTSLPVVVYNPEEMIGYRFFTIPLEDFFYGMLLIFLNITLYEYFKNKKTTSTVRA